MTSLRVLQSRPSAPSALICLPHAGGSATFFRNWAAERAEVEVMAIQYPGRADRLAEPCHQDLRLLATEIAADIAPLLDRPTTLFGHSMGAVVAFEVARRVESAGHRLTRVVASASRPPHSPDQVAPVEAWDDDEAVRRIVAMGLGDADLLADPRVRDLVLPYLRADVEMLQRYRPVPGPALHCDLLVVRGADDEHVTGAHGALWRELTLGRFADEVRPGGHFYLVPEPPIDLILEPLTSMRS